MTVIPGQQFRISVFNWRYSFMMAIRRETTDTFVLVKT
jgi:hypothetical protein